MFSSTATPALAAALALGILLGGTPRAAAPKFYADDPLWTDPETQDASAIQPRPISEQYDFVENSFLGAGERLDKRAENINTVGGVPDSSWFTNRAGRRVFTPAELKAGGEVDPPPADGPWTIVAGKTEGITPGMTIRDSTGAVFFLKFDPPANAEMASGAEIIATKFFHALGYHVPQNYLAVLRPESLVIGEGTTVRDEDGRRRPMRQRELDAIFKKAARRADGGYRVLASRAVPGREIGRFRYHGTRPDDPNDIFPHEHRRELRGLSVFAAWLNHDDSRSGNTLDMLLNEGGRSIVRHHLIDFGSALGSGSTQAQSTRAGNEYVWEARPTLVTMLTLGFYVRPWLKVDYPDYPAVGRFESNYFQPANWKPEYPNPAFRNARADDRFWAAHILAALSDEGIRAVVGAAEYTDRGAAEYVVETLLARKSKILMEGLNGTNPIVNPALSAAGALTFDNAAVDVGVAKAAERYTVQWSAFDNATGTHEAAGTEQSVTGTQAQAPAAVLTPSVTYVSARVRAFHPERPRWDQPVQLYFRRVEAGWRLVGLERQP